MYLSTRTTADKLLHSLAELDFLESYWIKLIKKNSNTVLADSDTYFTFHNGFYSCFSEICCEIISGSCEKCKIFCFPGKIVQFWSIFVSYNLVMY